MDDASPSQEADGPGRQPEIQNQFDSGAVSPDRVGGCPDDRQMNQCDNASRPLDHPVQMGQVQPLTKLTRKSVRFSWDQSCQDAFESLKSKLVTAPVLAYHNAEGQYILDTDASGHAVGAVLSQVQDGEERVIAYASKALHGGQENHCTTKRELLVEHFRCFLYGTHFTIITDHASLKCLRNFKNIGGMLARWLATLEKYDYQFVHRKGSQHSNADALSCLLLRKCPREDCPQCTLQVCPITARPEPAETDEWLLGWTNQELSQWQRNDPVLSKVIKWLESSPERPKNAAQYDGLTWSYLT